MATALSVATKAMIAFSATNFGASIGLIVTEIGAFIAGASNMTNVITALTLSMEACPLFWGALAVGGIALIVKAIDSVTVSLEEQIEKLNEAKSAYEDAKSSVESLESQLESINSKIAEINSQEGAKVAREGELNELNRQKAELESMLRIEKERLKLAQEQYETEAKKTVYKDVVKTKTVESAYGGEEEVSYIAGDRVQILKENSQAMKEYQDVINDTNATISGLNSKLENYGSLTQSEYEQREKAIIANEEALASYNKLNAESSEYASQLREEISLLNEDSETRQYAMEGISAYDDVLKKSEDNLEENKETAGEFDEELEKLSDNIEDLAKSLDLSNKQLERFSNLMDLENLEEFLQNLYNIRQASEEASGGIDSLQTALESALDAQAEYADQGYLTLDTFQSLMGISAEYLVALQNENGQLEINQTTLSNLVEQMKIAKIEELQAAATADILAYSQGNVGQMSDFAKSLVADLGVDIENTGRQADTASAQMINFSSSIATAVRAMGGEFHWDDTGVMAIVDGYKTVAKSIKDLTIDTSTYGNVASKSHSKATESVKKEKTEAEKLKEEYKDAIDFMLKQYDKKIDKIKEAKEAQLDAIDAEIKALERERDAREKYWNDQIDNLEKENDERERNIELQEKLQALALAQQSQVMIMKDGQFVYGQDEGEVASAEQDLAETQEQQAYERQKEALEELRDAELEWYDERIQALEDYKEKVEASYDEQIADLEAQKEAINEVLEESAVNQQEYWDRMMAQLSEFVAKWNAKVGEMKSPSILGKSTGDNSVKVSSKLNAYASGKGSVGDSELAVVGENPKYREIVIGSKLNNDQGAVMALKRGSGVVNAGATNTLASIFNALNGQNSNAQKVSNSTSNATSITIGSISLPEVKDGKGFVDYLQNFSADMTQMAFAR